MNKKRLVRIKSYKGSLEALEQDFARRIGHATRTSRACGYVEYVFRFVSGKPHEWILCKVMYK